MRFKEFLLNEAGFSDSGSDWFYGNYLYPSDAFDWEDSIHEPPDFKFVQARWDKEAKMGRKFHNIDLPSVKNTKFVGVYSNTMPEAGDGSWQHRADDRPNLKIDADADIKVQGVRRNAETPDYPTANNLVDLTDRLNALFGKFEPSYHSIPTNFDEPWNDEQGTTVMKRPVKRKGGKKWNNLG